MDNIPTLKVSFFFNHLHFLNEKNETKKLENS